MDILPNWHPVFVHFTVALLFTAVILFVLGCLAHKKAWGQLLLFVGRWNLWIGTGISLITVATGLYAFNTVAHDDAAHLAMTLHRNWALPTAGIFAALAVWSYLLWRRHKAYSPAFIAVAVIAALMLSVTGYLGGELVFRHGVGVQAAAVATTPPEAGTSPEAAHDHSH